MNKLRALLHNKNILNKHLDILLKNKFLIPSKLGLFDNSKFPYYHLFSYSKAKYLCSKYNLKYRRVYSFYNDKLYHVYSNE